MRISGPAVTPVRSAIRSPSATSAGLLRRHVEVGVFLESPTDPSLCHALLTQRLFVSRLRLKLSLGYTRGARDVNDRHGHTRPVQHLCGNGVLRENGTARNKN